MTKRRSYELRSAPEPRGGKHSARLFNPLDFARQEVTTAVGCFRDGFRKGLLALLSIPILTANVASAELTNADLVKVIDVCDKIRDAQPEQRLGIAKGAGLRTTSSDNKRFREWMEARNAISVKDKIQLEDDWRLFQNTLNSKRDGWLASLGTITSSSKFLLFVEWPTTEMKAPKFYQGAVSCIAMSTLWLDLKTQLIWHENSPYTAQSDRYLSDSQTNSLVVTNRDLDLGVLKNSKSRDVISIRSEKSPADQNANVTWFQVTLYPNAALN